MKAKLGTKTCPHCKKRHKVGIVIEGEVIPAGWAEFNCDCCGKTVKIHTSELKVVKR